MVGVEELRVRKVFGGAFRLVGYWSLELFWLGFWDDLR